jgi:hypothetical protein
MKTTSHFAMVAAAGLALSVAQASAADLGGNCCADLEERVAELEATTARKGNRKVSLTIAGQVNRTIMYWNDGGRSNTYLGLDNTNSSTRFGFSGNAKISSEWTAGYSILIDVADRARAVSANQINEDGGPRDNANSNADHLLRLRDANFWLQREGLGRVTMGRLTTSGPIGVIDLGGVSVVAATGEGCIGTSLRVRNGAGTLTNASIGDFTMGCSHPTFRQEGIKYTSPTWHGFVFSASIGEAAKVQQTSLDTTNSSVANNTNIGRTLGVDLRYANEFNGVRVAFGIGWEKSEVNEDDAGFRAEAQNGEYDSWGLSGSLLHVPTGLFVQAFWLEAEHKPAVAGGGFTAGNRADMWHIQAGVSRNYFGIGNTVFYGEYAQFNDWYRLNTAGLGQAAGAAPSAAIALPSGAGDELSMWGLGMVQSIDAAAMELYIGYRNFSASNGASATGLKDIDVVAAGARIRF